MHRKVEVSGDLTIDHSLYPMKMKASGRIVQIELCSKDLPALAGLPVSLKDLLKINSLIRSAGLKVTFNMQDKSILSLGYLLPLPGFNLIKRMLL